MARYPLAAALLGLIASAAAAHEGGDDEAWSYLPVSLPTPLSDMGITLLTTISTEGEAQRRIILTGGCDSDMGNEYREFGEDEWFECASLTNKVYAFEPIRNNAFQAWNGNLDTLADMPRNRYRHSSAVVNGNVCVFGGRNLTDHLIAEVDCYNAETNEWSTPAVLPEERLTSDFAAFGGDDGTVYLVGGYDQYYTALDRTTVMDMSDLSSVSYVDAPKLLSKRGDIDIAVVNGNAYVSGGFTHENDYAAPKNTVERFNVATGTWSNVDSLNEERGDKQLVAIEGRVFALGGESKVDVSGMDPAELPELGARSEVLDSVEVYNPGEDVHGGLAEWRRLGDMPGKLFRFGASEWQVDGEDDGYIFVFGGQVGYDSDCSCFRTTDKVLVFDVAHAEEELAETKSEPSGGARAFVAALATAATGALWLAM